MEQVIAKTFPRCSFCQAFRPQDVQHITALSQQEEKELLTAQAKPSPCLRLMPYCKESPRLR
jgi:hypothetical protein